MTGAELFAAKAAGKGLEIAAKALDEDKDTKSELLKKAKEDLAFDAAASAVARRIAVKQEIALQLYRPLARLLRIKADYFNSSFGNDMAEKLEVIPEEHRKTPKASVAIPAMEGIGITLEEPDLKEMYLNLLATASDDRRADFAHPSFVEIIKQLSSDEARFLPSVLRASLPIIQIRRIPNDAPNEYRVLQSHILNLADAATAAPVERPQIATYVDNWDRLGLVDVDYAAFLTSPGMYDWAESRPELARFQSIHQDDDATISVTHGTLNPTSFGRTFAQAVALFEQRTEVESAAPDRG